MSVIQAPYGSWKSPIDASWISRSGINLSEVHACGRSVFWLEHRPLEKGRGVIMERREDGTILERTPATLDVRTKVHEYGGGSFAVRDDCIVCSNVADDRLYLIEPGRSPMALTPASEGDVKRRYAEMVFSPDGRTIVCVQESHREECEPENCLVTIPLRAGAPSRKVFAFADFCSNARFSPDGRRLSWISWSHPNMPWDATRLWIADIDQDGLLHDARVVAGDCWGSIFQPEWSPQGVLYFVSDRSGWWNLYELSDTGQRVCVFPMEAEFGEPQWGLGHSRYTFLDNRRIACLFFKDGMEHLGVIDLATRTLERIEVGCTSFGQGGELRRRSAKELVFIGASPTQPPTVMVHDVGSRATLRIRSSLDEPFPAEICSTPEPIEFPTTNGFTAHALFYPPNNPQYAGLPGELPPLLVISHGGPTGAASSALNPALQFWTSRGFAVVDVNYSGSTGYGREYRERLNGRWGVQDVEDCIAASRFLDFQQRVDGRRAIIRGKSAGGYTTLCALTFHHYFAAGGCYYAVSDLTALAQETHKFESHYLERLVGPFPAEAHLYWKRSPIHFADSISCPVILFQGLEDKVVPPAQSQALARALAKNGVLHEYVEYPNEGHGFRDSKVMEDSLRRELQFYGEVLGIAVRA